MVFIAPPVQGLKAKQLAIMRDVTEDTRILPNYIKDLINKKQPFHKVKGLVCK